MAIPPPPADILTEQPMPGTSHSKRWPVVELRLGLLNTSTYGQPKRSDSERLQRHFYNEKAEKTTILFQHHAAANPNSKSNGLWATASTPSRTQQQPPNFRHSFSSQGWHWLRMFCCCLCCPIFRCALWFCCLELLVSIYLWYSALDDLVKTMEVLQLKDVLLLVILSGWLITLITTSVCMCIAEKRRNGEFVIPRIVQQSGLLIIGLLIGLMLVIYFAGASQSINGILISVYEYIFLTEPLPEEERRNTADTMKLYFMLLIPLDFFFVCYEATALAVSRNYQKQLSPQGRYFQTVSQVEPTAPQPPANPHYKGSV